MSFSAAPAFADIPSTLGYQGRLKNTAGIALTGTYSFTFRLYASSTGGVPVWSETQSVVVDQGSFAVQLGSSTAFPSTLDFNQPLFLTSEVNSDGEMTPRVPVNTVAYAMTAGGINALSAAPATPKGGRMYYDTTNGTLNFYNEIAAAWQALSASGTAQDLQNVTDAGNVTTNAIQFAGGTSTADFTGQGSLTVTGLTSLADAIFVNATGTNLELLGLLTAPQATITDFVATNATSINLFASNGAITNLTVTNVTSSNLVSTTVSTTNLIVNGQSITSGAPATTATLQAITNNGATTTNPLYAFGGVHASDLTVTGTSDVQSLTFTTATGTSATTTNLFATNATIANLTISNPLSVSGLTWTDATGTNTTSTNLFATNLRGTNGSLSSLVFTDGTSTSWLGFSVASGTTLNASAIAVNGASVCLEDGTNCPTGTSPNFQTITNSGNTTTNAIQFAGGTSTADFAEQGNLTVTGHGTFSTVSSTDQSLSGTLTVVGLTNLSDALFVDATGTNLGLLGLLIASQASIADLTWTNATGTNTTSTNLYVSGMTTTTQMFANSATVGSLSAGSENLTSLTFTNGTSTSWLGFTTASGTSVLATNGTIGTFNSSNGTITTFSFDNGTSTSWFGFATASGTTVNAANSTLTNLLATVFTSPDATISGGSINGTPIGASTPSTGVFTNVTSTSATTTNLFATNGVLTNGTVTNGTVSNLSLANGTSTSWFGFATASGTALDALSGTINSLTAPSLISSDVTISGGSINGTPIGAGVASTAIFTNVTSTGSLVTQGNLTVNGSTALQTLTFTNGTGTNMAFTSASGSSLVVAGQSVCLSGGSNCPAGVPNTKTVSSTSALTLTTSEQSALSLAIAPGNTANQIWVSGSAIIFTTTNSDRTVTGRIKRGSSCATGTQVGVNIAVQMSNTTQSATLDISFVDSPSSTSSVTYQFCIVSSGDSTTANSRFMTLQEVRLGADYGEVFYTDDPTLAPGEVVSIDPSRNDGVIRTTTPFSKKTIGVISTYPGFLTSRVPSASGTAVIVALTGRTPVKATNQNGQILKGDGLVSAVTPGYVMKATGAGRTVGTAMEDLDPSTTSTTGTIMMFVEHGIFLPTSEDGRLVNLPTFGQISVALTGQQPIIGPSVVAQFSGTTDTYLQINVQNGSTGTQASSDYVATNDIGDDSSYYIDMGINSSAYSVPEFSIVGPNDAYLYTNGANLAIGTASASTDVLFHAGGTTAADEVMRITSGHFVGIGTSTPMAMLDVAGDTIIRGSLTVGNLTVTGTSSFSDLTWTNATGTNTTSTNLFATNFSATNATVSGLTFTSGTSTSWFGFATASGTTVNATNAALANLIMGDATATNATTTNLYASGVVSTTQLYVNGKRACLEDGTNCQSPNIKTTSSTSSITLTTTEKDIVTVTTTPRVATNQMWIVVSANYLADTGGQTINYKIRRGAACSGGTLIGSNTTSTVDNEAGALDVFTPGTKSVAISFVDSPGTTSAVAYHLCATASTGSPTSQSAQITVEEVQFGADLGEVYYSDDATLAPGEVVAVAGTGEDKIRRATQDTGAIGVVSTRPGLLLSESAKNGGTPVIVALSGRVPVKVSLENGSIQAGDALTIGTQPGYAMKATALGPMVGRALSDLDGDASSTGIVMLFVQNGYYIPYDPNSSAVPLSGGSVSGTSSASSIQTTGQTPEVTAPSGSQTMDSLVVATLVVQDATFNGRVAVRGQAYFGADTVGEAKILSGATEVSVTFTQPYLTQPIVTVTPQDFVDAMYRVTDMTDAGFTIQLNAKQTSDKLFNWHAFGNDGGKLTVSDGTAQDINIIVSDDPTAVTTPTDSSTSSTTDGAATTTSSSTDSASGTSSTDTASAPADATTSTDASTSSTTDTSNASPTDTTTTDTTADSSSTTVISDPTATTDTSTTSPTDTGTSVPTDVVDSSTTTSP